MHSPSDLEVLLHCNYSPEPHPRQAANAVQSALHKFLENGLIECAITKGAYNTTARGKAYIQMLCTTPYPEQCWVNPLTKAVIEN